jgi:hypothetical protein
MINISIKFNNGSIKNFSYDNITITVEKLISDIGKDLYPETYNNKVNEYIKLIYMGKILIPSENLPFTLDLPITLGCKPEGLDLPINANYIFHCIIKNIPNDIFIIEQSTEIEIDKVIELFNNQDFINIIKQREVYEFIEKNLSKPDKIIKSLSDKILINTDKYKTELLLLNDMGFNNNLELLELLEKLNGNVEGVINILMT